MDNLTMQNLSSEVSRVESIQSQVKATPFDPQGYFFLADHFIQSSEPGKGLKACLKGCSYEDDSTSSLSRWAEVMQNAGFLKESGELYRQALARSPNQPQICRQLSHILQSLGEPEEAKALEIIAQAMEKNQDVPKTLQPHHLETCLTLAESLSNQGRLTEAIQLYQSALILSPYTKKIRQELQRLQNLEPCSSSRMQGRQLSPQEMEKYLDLFRRDGFVVIPEYYLRQDCERLRHDLEGLVFTYNQDIDFKDGAYIRHPSRCQQRKNDLGVSRIYHIDKKIKELQSLRYDDSIMRLVTLYTGKPFYSGVLWYQYNRPQEETRYFHVDIFGLQQQIKSIAYLEDVTLEKGPFCYIKGSHRDINLIRRRYEATQPPGQDSGYMEEEIRPILQNSVPVCGSAGSLVIADVGGVHRGLPQSRSRSILMQSFYSRPGDLPIGV